MQNIGCEKLSYSNKELINKGPFSDQKVGHWIFFFDNFKKLGLKIGSPKSAITSAIRMQMELGLKKFNQQIRKWQIKHA